MLGRGADGIIASCTLFCWSLPVLPCIANAAVLVCSTPAASFWGPVWSAMLRFTPFKGCWQLLAPRQASGNQGRLAICQDTMFAHSDTQTITLLGLQDDVRPLRCSPFAGPLCLQAWTDTPCLCCRVVEAIKGCRQQLLAICQDIVFEDPMAELCQQLQALSDPVLAASSLEAVAGNDMLSNTLVMFLRFLTSSELQAREDFFAPFVMVGRPAFQGPDIPHAARQRRQLADPMWSACQSCSCDCAGQWHRFFKVVPFCIHGGLTAVIPEGHLLRVHQEVQA